MILLENVNNATKQLILHIYFLQFKAQRVVHTGKTEMCCVTERRVSVVWPT